MKLPQRASSTQRRARQFADYLIEFTASTRARYLHPAKMVVQIDLAVFYPQRMVHSPWCFDQPPAQRIQIAETFLEGLAEGFEGERSAGPLGMHYRHLQCA